MCSEIMEQVSSHNLNNTNNTTSELQQEIMMSPQSNASSTAQANGCNQELDLNDYMTQLNLAQLAIMEKNSGTTPTSNHPHQSTQTAGVDDFGNLLLKSGELNNNNPLMMNNNVIANSTNNNSNGSNAGSNLQFADPCCPIVQSTTAPNSVTNLLSPHSQQHPHSPNDFFNQPNNSSPHHNNTSQQQQPNLPNFHRNTRMINCSSAGTTHSQQQQQSHAPYSHQSNSNHTSGAGRAKPRSVQIKYKFGRLGNGNGQLSSPHGFCLGVDEEIIIADTFNHRVCIFDKTGQFKHQFGIQGKEEGQLFYPRKCQALINKVIF